MTDYRTLLAEALTSASGTLRTITAPDVAADAALATHVPDLCPDCDDRGRKPCDCHEPHDIEAGTVECTHPNAPTIAKVLAVGHVMLEANGDLSRFADPDLLPADHVEAINSMLAYIITVEPSLLAALRGERPVSDTYTVHPIEQPTVLRFTPFRWSVRRAGIPLAVFATLEEAERDARQRDTFRRFNR